MLKVGLLLLLLNVIYSCEAEQSRTFVVDWENDRFLKDGVPFRFIAGSFHYFRAHPKTWQRKLRTMRAAGLNAVTTYVEWSLHNPKEGVYVWDGIADLEKFIQLAAQEDLLVILRPGPYICAERDFGGFPFWLLSKYPKIQLRTFNLDYLSEIRIWYGELLTKLTSYFYGNGGPIIMVQVENEYGSFYACDKKYRTWLRDETLTYVKDKAVLFTNDGPDVLACGYVENVLATMDFGSTVDVNALWNKLRRIQRKGPLVNAEYYPGWLTHWGEDFAHTSTESITKTFENMLLSNASVNFYVFYGGTNFGFTAGANDGGPGHYQPDITSYDYDAPMTEAGDPTPKYFALKNIISRYLPLPDIPVPIPLLKKAYGRVTLMGCGSILSSAGRRYLATGMVVSEKPKTFEELNQYSGLILYETFLPQLRKDPSILHVPGLRDRAYIFVDNNFISILSREWSIYDLPISLSAGKKLQILVENQGRINYGPIVDFKGIISDVTIDKQILRNFNMTKYPLESYEDIENFVRFEGSRTNDINSSSTLKHGPGIFFGTLYINESDVETYDTYLDTTGWGKGIAFINGENIGRYWPLAGPQITLYVPREILKLGSNNIVLIEYQRPADTFEIIFKDKANLSGNVW